MTKGERNKLTRYRLDDLLAGQLADYCEAFDDATAATVIKKALRAYITAQLEANPAPQYPENKVK